jgi:hypothetical protein
MSHSKNPPPGDQFLIDVLLQARRDLKHDLQNIDRAWPKYAGDMPTAIRAVQARILEIKLRLNGAHQEDPVQLEARRSVDAHITAKTSKLMQEHLSLQRELKQLGRAGQCPRVREIEVRAAEIDGELSVLRGVYKARFRTEIFDQDLAVSVTEHAKKVLRQQLDSLEFSGIHVSLSKPC